MLNNRKRVFGQVVLIVVGTMFCGYFGDPAWAQRSANVKDVENPDKLPIYGTNIPLSLALNPGEDTGNSCFSPAPEGKRIIIEHVSVRANVPSGQHIRKGSVMITNTATQYLVFTFMGDSAGYAIFTVSQPLRMRVPAGASICIGIDRSDMAGSATAYTFVSGYLVDYP